MKLLVTYTCLILLAQLQSADLKCINKSSYEICSEISHLQPSRRTKITVCVFSNIPNFEHYRLVLRLDSTDIQINRIDKEGGYNVTYNTCTDSNQADMIGKEIQVTLGWNVSYHNVSACLYEFQRYTCTELLNFSLRELQSNDGTENPTTTTTESSNRGDTTSGQGDSSKGHETGNPIGETDSTSDENKPGHTNANSGIVNTSLSIELIVVSTLAVLFGVLFLITLLVFIIYYASKKRTTDTGTKQKSTEGTYLNADKPSS